MKKHDGKMGGKGTVGKKSVGKTTMKVTKKMPMGNPPIPPVRKGNETKKK